MARPAALAAAVVVLTGPAAGAGLPPVPGADRDRGSVLAGRPGRSKAGRRRTRRLRKALTRCRAPQNRLRSRRTCRPVAALPDQAPAKHSGPGACSCWAEPPATCTSIPLAARTIEEMGRRRAPVHHHHLRRPINEKNSPNTTRSSGQHHRRVPRRSKDAAATLARRKALLDFMRGGRAGRHPPPAIPIIRCPRPFIFGAAPALAKALLAQGDKDGDGRLAREELHALADAWYDKVDPEKTGRVEKAAFPQRFTAVMPPPPPSSPQILGATGFPVQPPATHLGPDTQAGTWPEFNKMIGGFFKFHWNDGQVITVKVDEPEHPLNAPFKGQTPLRIIDETYTFGRDTYSRANVRVLTSVDYAAMSAKTRQGGMPAADGGYA